MQIKKAVENLGHVYPHESLGKTAEVFGNRME
jgi:hypothetical protein